ncbi:hypothetical protein DSOL_5447 [Desulfosporosinus metallidurans]|uniref:Uncharacterized protein n=1 Tax=Desulfosporosinus metallidurans TaxID=1888891 RepID=A0A1Q8QAC8_9FIRM|nr:hypothetical protein DSOL_5447 [Desulfosporosinus metallidurans]
MLASISDNYQKMMFVLLQAKAVYRSIRRMASIVTENVMILIMFYLKASKSLSIY